MNSRAAAPGVGEGLIWTADLGTARVRQRPRVATAFYELPARVGCAGGRGCEIEEATPPRCFLFKFSASEISASFEAARSFVLSRSRIIRGKSVALGWCAGGRSRPGSVLLQSRTLLLCHRFGISPLLRPTPEPSINETR